MKCSNCNKKIDNVTIMSPSINPKKRIMCNKCAKKLILKERPLLFNIGWND